jgi:hypothetical protein
VSTRQASEPHSGSPSSGRTIACDVRRSDPRTSRCSSLILNESATPKAPAHLAFHLPTLRPLPRPHRSSPSRTSEDANTSKIVVALDGADGAVH